MKIMTFKSLDIGDRFITAEIRNHAYNIVVWTKISPEYEYSSPDGAYIPNASSEYCYSAFALEEETIQLSNKEAVAQDEIYKTWSYTALDREKKATALQTDIDKLIKQKMDLLNDVSQLEMGLKATQELVLNTVESNAKTLQKSS